jgi:hypothetical protein
MNEGASVNYARSISLLVLLSIFFCRNSKQITEPIHEYPRVIRSPGIVRINDSIRVHISTTGPRDMKETRQWWADCGRVVGTGDTVVYFAPPDTGTASIHLLIQGENNTIEDSVKICIYKQIIILKADDFRISASSAVSPNWLRFIEFIARKKIKASLGLIGNSLPDKNPQYFDFVKELEESRRFELWNHGYEHIIGAKDSEGRVYREFMNTSYEYQVIHLVQTQNLAKEKLGLTLHTFGAPGNAIDENTRLALECVPEIKVWFFGMDIPGKMNLIRRGEIEFPTHFPDFIRFTQAYDPVQPCQVYQIHPNSWDENRFLEFSKIIDFLISEKSSFLNPYEYYLASITDA